MIAALLLAAGASRRFGEPKLLHMLRGRPVVRWSAESLVGAPVDEVVVVVPEPYADVARALEGLPMRFVPHAGAALGMASSLACGVAALDPATEAVVVSLADEPFAGREGLLRVVERFHAGDAGVVVPVYRGVRGHPVLFSRAVFPELLLLSGDHGARAVADRDPTRRAFIELDMRKPVDVDRPEDLSALDE